MIIEDQLEINEKNKNRRENTVRQNTQLQCKRF